MAGVGTPARNTETHEADHEGVPPEGDEGALLRVGAVPQADLPVDPPMKGACQPQQQKRARATALEAPTRVWRPVARTMRMEAGAN